MRPAPAPCPAPVRRAATPPPDRELATRERSAPTERRAVCQSPSPLSTPGRPISQYSRFKSVQIAGRRVHVDVELPVGAERTGRRLQALLDRHGGLDGTFLPERRPGDAHADHHAGCRSSTDRNDLQPHRLPLPLARRKTAGANRRPAQPSRSHGDKASRRPPDATPDASGQRQSLLDVEHRLLRVGGRARHAQDEGAGPDRHEGDRGLALVVELDAVDARAAGPRCR